MIKVIFLLQNRFPAKLQHSEPKDYDPEFVDRTELIFPWIIWSCTVSETENKP